MSALIDRQLYDTANSYHQAALVLMHNKMSSDTPATGVDLTHPAVFCATVSLKLYLASLSVLGERGRGMPACLSDLYESLDDTTKNRLIEKFDEYSNTASTSVDLAGRLRMLDDAVITWRYFLGEAEAVNLDELDEMILATKATIEELGPELR